MLFDTHIVSIFQDFVGQSMLTEFSVILTIVLLITGILKLFKQPLIIGYMLAGAVVGPAFLNIVHHHETVDVFARMGISLLLFMVGLGLSPQTIKGHGMVALRAGLFQIFFTVVLGAFVSWIFGFDLITSLYVGAAVAFSSTIVIVKLLSDKEEEDTLYGKLSIGILIVQDIVVMLLLMGTSLSNGIGSGNWWIMLLTGVLLLVWLYFFTHHVLGLLIDKVASSSELLLLFALGWCFLVGSMFDYVGFSMEIGTLLAGMSLAMSPYRIEIIHKLKSLRDFFLILFFMVIGMQLDMGAMSGYWGFFFVLLMLVILVKPLIVYVISRLLGYTPLVGAKAALSLGQISEFSLLLLTLGISYGHIKDTSFLSVMMFVGLFSICLSTYTTSYNTTFLRFIDGIRIFPHRFFSSSDPTVSSNHTDADVLLFGCGRIGMHLVDVFLSAHVSYVVVDHDPVVIKRLHDMGVHVVFADADNIDAYQNYLHGGVKMCISTMRAVDENLSLIRAIKAISPSILVLVVAHDVSEALVLYKQGADYVIMPHRLSAHHTSLLLEELGFDIDKFVLKKLQHTHELGITL